MTATTTTAPVHDARQVNELLSRTEEQLAAFGQAPTPVEDFVTFFDPGWSILQLRQAVKERGTIFYRQNWYSDEPFAKSEEPPRYRQLRMAAVEGSFRKTYADQCALVPKDEEVPTARVLVTAMVIHFLATGHRLYPDHYLRCSDVNSDGGRVSVGGFAANGLNVYNYWDVNRNDRVGLASARKS